MTGSKSVSLEELKSRLTHTGIAVDQLRTLREIAVEGDDQLAGLPISEVEQQYPIHTLAVPLDSTMLVWKHLRTMSEMTGFHPVILGDREDVNLLWSHREDAKLPQEYLDLAQTHDAKTWLNNEWEHHLSDDPDQEEIEYLHGHWNERFQPITTFDVSRHYRWISRHHGQYQSELYIGLLPTAIPWEIPAYLGFGNWNDCPSADIHIAVQRYWHSLFQTEIVSMTSDAMVCWVGNPVATREAAIELAHEQVGYCSDIPPLIGGALAHASRLINSTYWDFWWD